MTVYSIIQELNGQNSTNYKIDVLKKYKGSDLFTRVLCMTYDLVKYNYGVGKVTLQKLNLHENKDPTLTLEQALDILESEFVTRKVTGNAAISRLEQVLNELSSDDQFVLCKIIERDLKVNLGKTQINKVHKGLITKPAYCRCDVYSDKTSKNIGYPAYCQLKADGTYREFNVQNQAVTARSRSGESYEYPVLFEQLKNFPDGIYIGELTVEGAENRAVGNGLISSDNPPHSDIILELWDVVSHEEYTNALKKDKKSPCTVPYRERFFELCCTIESKEQNNVRVIPYVVVENLQQALRYTSEMMSKGFEGTILKDSNMVFKDGTSKQQLKLKLEISAEMRCVGFTDGTLGTKREGKVGAIVFANDEGTIKGRCSGFTDEQLDYFTEHKDEFIGKIMEVQFNDLSKARDNDYYALSHPRFIEWRNDKDETDDLNKVLKLREMAMNLL